MGKKNHISRLAAPRTWPIKRKGQKWIAKPIPGSHNLETSVPLVVLLRDMLSAVGTSKEVKTLIHLREILVNQTVPKNIKLPVGLFDIISIPKLKLNYRVSFGENGKLKANEIKQTESNFLPLKVKSKTNIRGGKTQLNFSNGRNLLVDKDSYSINDVVVMDLSSKKIKEHVKFGAGKKVFVAAGKRLGSTGVLKSIKKVGILKKDNIATVESNGKTWETKAEYLFVQ